MSTSSLVDIHFGQHYYLCIGKQIHGLKQFSKWGNPKQTGAKLGQTPIYQQIKKLDLNMWQCLAPACLEYCLRPWNGALMTRGKVLVTRANRVNNNSYMQYVGLKFLVCIIILSFSFNWNWNEFLISFVTDSE